MSNRPFSRYHNKIVCIPKRGVANTLKAPQGVLWCVIVDRTKFVNTMVHLHTNYGNSLLTGYSLFHRFVDNHLNALTPHMIIKVLRILVLFNRNFLSNAVELFC